VQRIWAAHRLQPHRLRSFKRSRDPEFITKLAAIVGLYLAPPRHAVVLSVDEKSQIQALDRTHHRPTADDPTAEQRRPYGAAEGRACRSNPARPGR
jgi:hypothetical protein